MVLGALVQHFKQDMFPLQAKTRRCTRQLCLTEQFAKVLSEFTSNSAIQDHIDSTEK